MSTTAKPTAEQEAAAKPTAPQVAEAVRLLGATLSGTRREAIDVLAALIAERDAAVALHGVSPFVLRSADKLAFAALDLIERRVIGTRTALSDELEHYADARFDVMDGTGIAKLRALAAPPGPAPAKENT